MSERIVGVHFRAVLLAVGLAGLLALRAGAAGGPIDVPASTEPRVAVAKSLSANGFLSSQGTFLPFERVKENATLYTRDLLVVLPGFRASVQPLSKAVRLTLWGNMPGLSDSPVLDSAVMLHDSSHYDLDFTLLRGRVVLSNTKKTGAARVWLRTEIAGVALTLPEPGDRVALEIYGRWAPGVPFSLKKSEGNENAPVRLWQITVLRGRLDIKAGRNEWTMSAPPGRASFHGDSIHGPDDKGPQPLDHLPAWADSKAAKSKTAKLVESVVSAYRDRLKSKTGDPDEVASELLAAADKDTNKSRAAMLRQLVVYALAATDDVEKVVELLATSKHDEVRKTAVIALRHWIGVRGGRDEKLYTVLVGNLDYSKAEAATLLQLLHSPFAQDQPETYETLIAYLRHRRQAIRELAHWHLIRLSPVGQDIPFDASASAAERDKAAALWKKLIPAGQLPKEKEAPKKKKTKG
jgi:hypothetical protein